MECVIHPGKVYFWTVFVRRIIFACLGLLSLAYGLNGCKDDMTFTTSGDMLNIKADTIVFDTVFTSPRPGVPFSVNKQFVVLNPYKEAIRSNIRIAGGDQSVFRMNIDGASGREFDNVEILPEDSVFIFLELTIDPNNDPQSLPLIVRDSILFETNGGRQQVQLVAWGQDAHYFFKDTLCDAILDDAQKPYVVFDYLYVPENCKLTIEKGVKIHFAPGSWLFTEGTLEVNGTAEDPVYFEGDRLQPDFEEVVGQWGGLYFLYPTKQNRITHARIKNGTVGIYCDSISSDGDPTVEVYNTEIRNMAFDGLSGRMANMRAENSVFANCARYSFLGLYGGEYALRHCTFVTYNYDFARRDPTFILNNIERDQIGNVLQTYDMAALVQNCIIEGSLDNELALDLDASKVLGLSMENNLIRTELEDLDVAPLNNVINEDPRLTGYQSQNYELDSLSAAKDIGKLLNPPIGNDFSGSSRDNPPDAGAFESKY